MSRPSSPRQLQALSRMQAVPLLRPSTSSAQNEERDFRGAEQENERDQEHVVSLDLQRAAVGFQQKAKSTSCLKSGGFQGIMEGKGGELAEAGMLSEQGETGRKSLEPIKHECYSSQYSPDFKPLRYGNEFMENKM